MHKKIVIAWLIHGLMILTTATFCWGLTITTPTPGTVFHPGDKVMVKVVPAPSETLKSLWVYAAKTSNSAIFTLPPYNVEFTIDAAFTGTETIVAVGRLVDDKVVESKIDILVTLPSTVTLTGIRVDDDQKYLFLRVGEKEKVYVKGQYSDGVERDASSAATGTIYTTSDEKIAVADSNGRVTAVAPGKAKIAIKNGDKQVDIDVVVKAKK